MRMKRRILAALLALATLLPLTIGAFAEGDTIVIENDDLDEEYVDLDAAVTTPKEDESDEFGQITEEAVPAPKEEKDEASIVNVSEKVRATISALGILSNAEMKNSGYAQRAFAAEVLMRMAKIDTSQAPSGNVYVDVNENDAYAYAIEKSTDMGYFRGIGDGKFDPNGEITDYQMATVLLRFAGYEGKIDTSAFYPKLYKNVNTGNNLTYSDMANMIYNMLNLGTLKLTSVGKTNVYQIDENDLIMNELYDTETASGIIIKNGKTGLYSENEVLNDRVEIQTKEGTIVIYVGNTDISDALGKYVDAYYTYDSKNDKNICLGYDVVKGKNNIVELDIDQIDSQTTSGSNRELHYTDANGREKKLSYNQSAAIIYNGTYYADADFSFDMLENYEGTVCAIDNNSDGKYEVFNITAYKTYMVRGVVLSDNIIIYDTNNAKNQIILNDDYFDEYSITNKEGVKAYLEDFDLNTVVSVMENSESAENRYAKVLASTENVVGVVKDIEIDDNGYYIITMDDGVDYKVLKTVENTPAIGENVKLFISALGKVAKITRVTDGGYSFGMVLKKKYSHKDDKLEITLLTADNTIEEFTVTEKLKVDGTTAKTPSNANDLLDLITINDIGINTDSIDWSTDTFPVRYRFANDGRLAELDTPHRGSAESANSLTKMMKLEKELTIKNSILGSDVPMLPSTKVIKIDADGVSRDYTSGMYKRDTNYTTVTTVSALADRFLTSTGYFLAYKVDSESIFADLMLQFDRQGTAGNITQLFMVDKISQGYNNDEEVVVTKLSGYLSGVKTEILASPSIDDDSKTDIEGLQRGDVIQYGTDLNGNISNLYVVVKNNSATQKMMREIKSTGNGGKDLFTNLSAGKLTGAIIYGYVIERKGDCVRVVDITHAGEGSDVLTLDRAGASTNGSLQSWIRIPGSTPVSVYDREKDEVYAGTYDEIKDGAKCSVIGLRYRSSKIEEIVVFND